MLERVLEVQDHAFGGLVRAAFLGDADHRVYGVNEPWQNDALRDLRHIVDEAAPQVVDQSCLRVSILHLDDRRHPGQQELAVLAFELVEVRGPFHEALLHLALELRSDQSGVVLERLVVAGRERPMRHLLRLTEGTPRVLQAIRWREDPARGDRLEYAKRSAALDPLGDDVVRVLRRVDQACEQMGANRARHIAGRNVQEGLWCRELQFERAGRLLDEVAR
eukprot:16434727-Heterocapsa_arctica.AAC.1